MSTPEPPRNWTQRLTVRAWFQLVLAVMVLVVVVGAGLSALATAKTTRVSDRFGKQIQPAVTQAYRLQGALANQETGVRGYALTADPQFLVPFDEGRREENLASTQLRTLLHDRPDLLADVDELENAAGLWRSTYADPLIASVANGGTRILDPAATARGKAAFDRLRAHFTTQNSNLDAAAARDRADLARTRSVRDAALIGMVAAFLVTGLALTVLVRRLIARPLQALETASARVAGGDFGHHITVHGPADLMTVAAAVEAMRVRIVTELESSRITETRLAEQAADLDAQSAELRRSNAELEQFAYVASHDLQEPLRKVASFCQLLEKRYGDQLDDRAKQYIEFAVDGAKRMQVLINDLLTFSRVGRVNDHTASVGLDHTLDKALSNLGAAVEDSGAQIERPERLPEVTGDSTLLVMLWQNLIGNAIKFQRPGEPPRVRIECEAEPGPDGGRRFSVTDNGIGIAPEFADKVFVIFQRLHSRDEYTGTGIGLALSKKIVEFHGGRIWIDTDYTGGTRFCFTLAEPAPRAVAPEHPTTEPGVPA
ncbi:CHASE3 domain-containing protein [Nocardia sp. NPDC005978]|uniref:sensor histidine kinase n=1 Tax=Nocardia sp. NPDC005978 TaxID=3156725 RepID=UPI0033ADE9CB